MTTPRVTAIQHDGCSPHAPTVTAAHEPRCIFPTMTEPGTVRLGEWAHIRWGGHHLVVADEPDADPYQPVRVACGKRFERSRVWHDAPLPHLPQCKACQRTTRRAA